MKLLVDENLSPLLVRRIDDLFPGSLHVRSVDLKQTPDKTVWKYARSSGFSILTADSDFYHLAVELGHPPKVIWLRGCNYPTAVAERIIRSQAIRIAHFLNDPDRAVLLLKP